ncbi:MAG: hypothetical protein JWM28_2543 [Chitinophagaceae bacterium]|nr:hypothetical protein [Chitinophagaceae bacterium]
MSNTLQEKINIFLTVSTQTLAEHFNANDPAPIYKRQLSYEFEQYIMAATLSARRYTLFEYKVTCKNQVDKQYTEPLIYALRRHFEAKKLSRQAAFERFKRRNYVLLILSLAVVMLLHVAVPLFVKEEGGIHSAIVGGLDIFSWVMLWQPIDKLLFQWNPYLKEINTLNKLAKAEAISTENA